MKNYELLKEILVDVARILLDQKLICSPFQIAISEYNPKEKWGKYLIFCVDVSPLIEYTHRILSRYDKTISEYKSNLEALSKKHAGANNEYLKLRYYEKAIVKNSYEVLRNIKFQAPLVLSEFYSKCREEKNSQQNADLLHNPIYIGSTDRPLNWRLGCFLEKELFSAGVYNNFSSTFFVFKENEDYKNNNTIIYSISVFNSAIDSEKVKKGELEIVKLIDSNKKVALLEDVLDKIPDSESSKSGSLPADVKEEIS